MKIVITGAKGQLGQDLVKVFSAKSPDFKIYPFSHQELEVADFKKVMAAIPPLQPDFVIHTAAYTDVDGCEKNPNQAHLVNALGTRNIALACQKASAAMVYFSTDYVFDGQKGFPYTEFDRPNPLSAYGKSKLRGENYVKNLLNRWFIIRTSWLYGKGKNFVQTILELAQEKKELSVVQDQIGSPTFTKDLAKMVAELIEAPPEYGLYHITNQGSCSWYEFAKEILKLAGIKGVAVKPTTAEELNRPAPRPAFSALQNLALELQGKKLLRPWREALKEYLGRGKSVT